MVACGFHPGLARNVVKLQAKELGGARRTRVDLRIGKCGFEFGRAGIARPEGPCDPLRLRSEDRPDLARFIRQLSVAVEQLEAALDRDISAFSLTRHALLTRFSGIEPLD
jgi:hypothetical protein